MEHAPFLDSDIGHTKVVTKLVLARIVVQEAVKDSAGGRGVSQHLSPVFHRPVGGQDDRSFFVPAHKDFE